MKQIEYKGDTYTVRELVAKDMMALWADSDAVVDQSTLMTLAVQKNGEAIENIETLSAGLFIKIVAAFNELNDFGDLGND